jgi:Zn-dependent M28 family amino/carboxypeptidase
MLMLRLAALLGLALQAPAVAFDSSRAFEHLRRLVAFGPRPAGSAAIEQTRSYIKSELATAGVTVVEQAWEERTPIGPLKMVNLIATLPGASKNRLIIGGHYDTKRFQEFRFVGANDGGSSAAFLLELARVLKARRHALTIELLFLDGEEAVVDWVGDDNTYGSRHYVATARKDGSLASIKAFVLVDMIADRDLQLTRELNSTPWLDALFREAANRQKLGPHFNGPAMALEDDHLPFLKAGIPSVDLIDFDFPAWHTAGDTLDVVSARSLQVVGDVLLAALPQIEARLQ